MQRPQKRDGCSAHAGICCRLVEGVGKETVGLRWVEGNSGVEVGEGWREGSSGVEMDEEGVC